MKTTTPSPGADTRAPLGRLLQHWRGVRRMSQLDLSLEAEVSARHVSFLETGRARPSQEMVLTLADALDIPFRERNDLLLAAGYAPLYRESGLDTPELAPAQRALELILEHQEPFPAVVMDRHWNLVRSNAAAGRFFGLFLGPEPAEQPPNVLRMMFDPEGLRPAVVNWEAVGYGLVRRVYREAVGGVADETLSRLLDEVLSFPGVPRRWRHPDLDAPSVPFLPVDFRHGERIYRYFSAVTTLGTPQDITLQEIRIECFFPADSETERQARRLAASR